MQDINNFSEKLKDLKFSELSALSAKQIEELDNVLNSDIPKLMEVGFLWVVSCALGRADIFFC